MFTARMRVRARACTNVRIEFGEEGGGRRMMIHVNDRLGSKTSLLVSPDTSIKVSVRMLWFRSVCHCVSLCTQRRRRGRKEVGGGEGGGGGGGGEEEG